jgi:hypothetical protein
MNKVSPVIKSDDSATNKRTIWGISIGLPNFSNGVCLFASSLSSGTASFAFSVKIRPGAMTLTLRKKSVLLRRAKSPFPRNEPDFPWCRFPGIEASR